MRLLTLTFTFFLITPLMALAETQYQPLVGIPGISADATIGTYVNAIFYMAIVVGAILAVFRIIIAGVQWMFSDIVTTKQQAIINIRGAFFGLLILVGMTVVFREINDDILNLDVLPEGENILVDIGRQQEEPDRLDREFCPEGTEVRFITVEPGYECITITAEPEEDLDCEGNPIDPNLYQCPCGHRPDVGVDGRSFSCVPE